MLNQNYSVPMLIKEMGQVSRYINTLTKLLRSLGRLEELAI
ncbi:nicotinate-nucleotide--dimethylbenzimidazole phosphoribosyltransferase [Lentibacillus cibarius]|nr:nicotinate-nucleotide--dimethylbenzimidazole phosphoribosyltransferase [Lentibacillus cibarius]